MKHHTPHTESNESVRRQHETSDAHFRSVLLTGIGFMGTMVLGMLISWGAYSFFSRYTAAPGSHAETFSLPNPDVHPPGPPLQADPHAALVKLRRSEDSILTSYAWVSKDSGFVRIPVRRAMELLVKKGLPHREEAK